MLIRLRLGGLARLTVLRQKLGNREDLRADCSLLRGIFVDVGVWSASGCHRIKALRNRSATILVLPGRSLLLPDNKKIMNHYERSTVFGNRSVSRSLNLVLVASLLCCSTSICVGQTASERLEQLQEQARDKVNEKLWLEFEPQGTARNKRIVLIAGDDEYRSEQVMPMLGKILSQRHGFDCTVLFPIDSETGTIKPDFQTNIPGMHTLDDADLVILGLRFRRLPDRQMKHFVDYFRAGKPFIGLRTSTHAFRYGGDSISPYKRFSFNSRDWRGGFGQQVLGDTWISHHGLHKVESCRGVIEKENADSPILNGVKDVWGPSDVYGIKHLPEDANILLRGQVLAGMTPESKPVEGRKNNPMMPLAWTLVYESESGKTNRVFNTTMGASTDFECEDLRRLIVNASYWAVGLESQIPDKANVDFVDAYRPYSIWFWNLRKRPRAGRLRFEKVAREAVRYSQSGFAKLICWQWIAINCASCCAIRAFPIPNPG